MTLFLFVLLSSVKEFDRLLCINATAVATASILKKSEAIRRDFRIKAHSMLRTNDLKKSEVRSQSPYSLTFLVGLYKMHQKSLFICTILKLVILKLYIYIYIYIYIYAQLDSQKKKQKKTIYSLTKVKWFLFPSNETFVF